jgi:hypothetical protein
MMILVGAVVVVGVMTGVVVVVVAPLTIFDLINRQLLFLALSREREGGGVTSASQHLSRHPPTHARVRLPGAVCATAVEDAGSVAEGRDQTIAHRAHHTLLILRICVRHFPCLILSCRPSHHPSRTDKARHAPNLVATFNASLHCVGHGCVEILRQAIASWPARHEEQSVVWLRSNGTDLLPPPHTPTPTHPH